MDNTEFDGWWESFGESFPTIHDTVQTAGHPAMLAWRRALAEVPLSDAFTATGRLARGDGPQTFGKPEDYRAAIVSLCHTIREERPVVPPAKPKWHGGERSYRCPICQDRDAPTVLVIHPRTMKQIADGVEWAECRTVTNHVGHDTCAVACSCETGQRWNDALKQRTRMHVYTPDKMFRLDSLPCNGDEPEGLAEWVAEYIGRRVERMPNHDSGFDDFNRGV